MIGANASTPPPLQAPDDVTLGAIASTPSPLQAPDDVPPSLTNDIHGFYEAKDGTVWCKSVPPPTRTPTSNIFKPPVRQVRNPKNLYTVGDAYKRLINARMIQKVVCCTDLEGERVYGKNWEKTDATEIEGFVGCLLHLGALRDNRTTTTVLGDKTNGNQLLRACFSRNRFLKLSNHLRFDDKSTRQSRRARDAFAPFREIWDDFNLNLGKEYIPGPMLTVDEQLMPWRGRCGFLQYLPSKPDKYGLKIFWICDADNGYPLHGEPYLGKVGRSREMNIGRNTAIALSDSEPYFGSGTGRNLTVDHFFTDMALSTHLLANNITLLGTVRNNKRFLPNKFQSGEGLKKGNVIFGFQKKSHTILAYKSNQKKHVVVISTMHHDDSFDIECRKPEMVSSSLPNHDDVCHNHAQHTRLKW
ncbi:PiggyBac transposable element-derived protein 4 [Elysia marginata]|uniref:PiggyBac transposable element-derived protein 4 n=1 Tax=Elysia marginata TaxID=1093978 RepID=A0AAV4J7Z4_9GAST|nr:PiggyBac transposable element-derived protein 4 [Elysia marginata]